jgi:hypothetical protein
MIIGFLVRSSLKSAVETKITHSIYMRIMVNFVSIMTFIAEFDMSWPNYANDWILFQQYVGAAVGKFYGFECITTETGDSIEYYYQSLIIHDLFPIFMILLLSMFWGVVSLVRNTGKYMKIHLISSIIVV